MKTYIELHANNEQKTIIVTKHITYLNLEKGKLTIGLDTNQTFTITSNNIEETFDNILSSINTVDLAWKTDEPKPKSPKYAIDKFGIAGRLIKDDQSQRSSNGETL